MKTLPTAPDSDSDSAAVAAAVAPPEDPDFRSDLFENAVSFVSKRVSRVS